MRQLAIKIHPHVKPTHARHRPMPMPLARPVKTRLPCPYLLPSRSRINNATPPRDKPKTKLPQYPSFFTFELVVRRMSRSQISLVRPHVLPARMSHIKRLLKETVLQRESVCLAGRVSHFDASYKPINHNSIAFTV